MKRFFGGFLLCAVFFLCGGCSTQIHTPWQYADTAMGTVIQQNIYAADGETAESFSKQAMELLKELEEQQISWRLESSEVAQLNRTAGSGEAFFLSQELSAILQQCLEVSQLSDGAFDVTIGSVARLWNIDSWAAGEQTGDFQLPEKDALQAALLASDGGKLTLEAMSLTLPAGMQIDLGAVGKGLALAMLYQALQEQTDISGAVISAGGSILTYGTKPDASDWKVGIVNPFDSSQNIGVLSLQGTWYVATSGDYERYVEVDGVRYHHIIDPTTGYPADSGVRSVTILSHDGLLSDALSTACFVLGAEEGLKLAKMYDSEAVFVLDDGEMVLSEGLTKDSNGMIVLK